MRVIISIILLSFCLYSCSDIDKGMDLFKYDTEVIAVFTPRGVGNQTRDWLIYKGIIKTTDSLNLAFRPIFPLTYEEGAMTMNSIAFNTVSFNKA